MLSLQESISERAHTAITCLVTDGLRSVRTPSCRIPMSLGHGMRAVTENTMEALAACAFEDRKSKQHISGGAAEITATTRGSKDTGVAILFHSPILTASRIDGYWSMKAEY